MKNFFQKSNFKLLLSVFVIVFFTISFSSICLAEETPTTPTPADDGNIMDTGASNTYNYIEQQNGKNISGFAAALDLNVPLLGTIEVKSLVQYLLTIYQTALYIIVPLTIIVVIYGGILWVAAGFNPENKNKGKDHIIHGFIGLFIALGSYIILSLIGITSLTDITIEQVPGMTFMDPEVYKAIFDEAQASGGGELGNFSGDIEEMSKQVAKALGIDPCIAVTILKKESNKDPKAIGHDARVGNTAAHRLAGSGVTPPCPCPKETMNTNDDLGLDFRFSHGIGLGQLTFGKAVDKYCLPGDKPSRQFGDKCFTPKMALPPQQNMEASLKLWKSRLSGTDYQDAFKHYNGAAAYAASAMSIYNKCKAGGG